MVSIYVGNLPFRVTEDEVASIFSEFGEVQRVHLVMDRETGRPRGFGFVEMGDDEGRQAIQELMDRNAELGGRPLKLNEAQPREERGGGGGFAAACASPALQSFSQDQGKSNDAIDIDVNADVNHINNKVIL